MDRWRYFDITHTDHDILNPLSSESLDELVTLLGPLGATSRLLDIACGKAEPLVRMVERYGLSAVGVDLSPPFVAASRERVTARVPGAEVQIVESDGANYRTDEPFDVAMCLGASWIWQGYEGTLKALADFVRRGGLIVSGEPFWKQTPTQEYLDSQELTAEMFGTHEENVATGVRLGLNLEYALAGATEDFDRYEALQWRAAERFAASNPDDPDAAVLLEQCRGFRDSYLRWGRDSLGWAVYVFATPR